MTVDMTRITRIEVTRGHVPGWLWECPTLPGQVVWSNYRLAKPIVRIKMGRHRWSRFDIIQKPSYLRIP